MEVRGVSWPVAAKLTEFSGGQQSANIAYRVIPLGLKNSSN